MLMVLIFGLGIIDNANVIKVKNYTPYNNY